MNVINIYLFYKYTRCTRTLLRVWSLNITLKNRVTQLKVVCVIPDSLNIHC